MAKRTLVLANNPLLSGPELGSRERSGSPYRELKISAIERDSNQPRVNFDEEKLKELSHSIKTYGVLSPILVVPGRLPGRFKLVSGERRFRAAILAGLSSIPAIIDKESTTDGGRTLAVQLVENIQRSDLTPLERAHAIGALKESYNLSIRQIADKLGISKAMVQRSLEILELPDDLMNALREGAAESKILLLAKIDDPEVRASYLKDLDVLTRSKLQKELDSDEVVATKPSARKLSPEDTRIADEIQRSLGLKTTMLRPNPHSDQGKLVIEFYSEGDLQEVFRRLVSES